MPPHRLPDLAQNPLGRDRLERSRKNVLFALFQSNPRDRHRAQPYADHVARRAEDLTNDPVLVLIEDKGSDLTVEEWLASLKEDGATEVNANAAEILREIREHGGR